LGSLGNGPGFLGEWVYSPYFEVLNVPFLMEIGDFTFFQNLFFLNLDYTWTFISIVERLFHIKLKSIEIPQDF
jgi:hypothetical protein